MDDGGGGGKWGEMTQTLHAHMNKRNFLKKEREQEGEYSENIM
jgi:hypothetical protein